MSVIIKHHHQTTKPNDPTKDVSSAAWNEEHDITGLIQPLTGTAAWFAANNPVLLLGQLGYETDKLSIKIGDGSTAYNTLTYVYRGLPVAGEPSMGTPHPHECFIIPDATAKAVGTYTVDLSGEVPIGATMVYFTGIFQSATINAEVYVESFDATQVACHSYCQNIVSVATLVGMVRLDSSRRFRFRVVTATVILYEFKIHFYFG